MNQTEVTDPLLDWTEWKDRFAVKEDLSLS